MLTKVEHQTETLGFANRFKESKKKKDKVTKFIEILFNIFESSQQQEIFSWTPDGAGILISNHVEFAEKILPKYFKHSNFASFIRQLNIYGFKKIKSETCDNHYSHPMFRSGHKELLCKIKRKKVAMKDTKNPIKKPEVAIEGSVQENDKVMQENQFLKRKKMELTENLMMLNQKIEKITAENEMLSERCMSQHQQIERLKIMLMPSRAPQSNANLNPLLGHELQQIPPDFSFPGVSQQLSTFMRTNPQQTAPKQHFQMAPSQIQQPQQTLPQHQQLFTNPQLMMRQQQIYEAMRFFPAEQTFLENPSMRFNLPLQGSDPSAFAGSNLKLGAHAALPTDHLTDPIELLEMGEMQGHSTKF